MSWKQRCNCFIVLLALKFVDCAFIREEDIRPKPIWNPTYIDKLKKDVLLNYDKFARPTQFYNTTTVQIGMTIHRVNIDEFHSTLHVLSWISLQWSDEKLKWDSNDYGGLKVANFADHEIWQPDITLYNSVTGGGVSQITGTNCVVRQSGVVVWVPSVNLVAFCELNLRLWPFDTQTCSLKLGSWAFDGTQIDLQADSNIDYPYLIARSAEWLVTNISVERHVITYPCCEEPYVDISYKIVLTRQSNIYRHTIITTAYVSPIFILLSFLLPPQSGEKIMLNGCTAVVIYIYMIYFTQRIPSMGSHTPLIVIYYSCCLYIVSISTMVSIVVIWISRTGHTRRLPRYVKELLTGRLGKYLRLNPYIKACQKVENVPEQETEQNNDCNMMDDEFIDIATDVYLQNDWILLAAAIDRIVFLIFDLIFAVFAFTLYVHFYLM